MKKIGLIGGLSWQSTVEYYRYINEAVAERAGGRHAAKILIDSLDFGEVEAFILKKDYAGLASLLIGSARMLEQSGAELLLIGANTPHFLAPQVQESIGIPLIHIVDSTIDKIREKNLTVVALLGTKFTMEQGFFIEKLTLQGMSVHVPEPEERDFIHDTIFSELFYAVINPATKEKFLKIIDGLVSKGAQGIILGCTEIPLLIHQQDCSIPVFDTTKIHSLAAVEMALEQ
jgi:aspartate racemase